MNSNRTIALTGISRGLGRAMLVGFAAQGHIVCGCSRNTAVVQQLRDEDPPPHRFHVVDVSDDAQVTAWATESTDHGTAVDLLINNAALMNANAALWDVPASEFAALVDVNIKGTYHVIRHFLPGMIARGQGVIVNFSSGWGRSTSPEVTPYCATKWAIEGLSRGLAQELPRGLAAVALNPGVIHTEMLESCFGGSASSYPSPTQWADRAVPFLLSLNASDNGASLDVPA